MNTINSPFSTIIDEALKHDESKIQEASEIGQARIRVLGCGGGGCNAINWLYKKGIKGAEIIAINTDKQHLDLVEADKKILIGRNLTRGLGCGGFVEKGKESAKEQIQELKKALHNSDMVFVAAGLGGGTGTGSSPIIGGIAKNLNAIVIGVVTMPFDLERTRLDKAEQGLQELREVCDTVIVIDNNKLVNIAGNLPLKQAFAVANELISTMIKGIVEIVAVPSLVNLDYADVKSIMTNGDVSVIGIGESDSSNKVEESVKNALNNPLLEVDYDGASGALIHVTGGPEMTLEEVNKIGEIVTQTLNPEADVIWGSRISNDFGKRLRVMTIITGVKSPHILGKPKKEDTKKSYNNFFGIDHI